MFDDELTVVAGGFFHCGSQFCAVANFGNADRGSQIGGLHEDWVLESAFDQALAFRRACFPIAAQNCHVLHEREIGGAEELLHDVFIHAAGGTENSCADVGDVGEFE